MVKGQLPLLSRSSAVFTGFSKVEATITANIMFWYWRPSCHMSIHICDCLPSWRTQWRTCQTVQMWRGRRSWTLAFDFSAKVLSSPRADQHTLKHQKSSYYAWNTHSWRPWNIKRADIRLLEIRNSQLEANCDNASFCLASLNFSVHLNIIIRSLYN